MNINHLIFFSVYSHFYGKSKKLKSLISIWKFYITGEKYQVPKILEISKQHIVSVEINEDDFWDVIDSDVFSHPLFFDKVSAYLKENAEKIINCEKFFHAPESFLFELLGMDTLNVNEYDLLLSVTEWGYRNFKPANAEKLLKLYKHIRFSNLTFDEFFIFISIYPDAIEAKSSLEILQYLYTPYCRFLPEWCSSNKISRRHGFHQGELTITIMLPKDKPLRIDEIKNV